jgi:hypothetical protein
MIAQVSQKDLQGVEDLEEVWVEAMAEVSGDVVEVSGDEATENHTMVHNLMYILNRVRKKRKLTLRKWLKNLRKK